MSNLTLIIGNKNYSSWSLRPWIFMKQMDIDFTEKRIPLYNESSDQQLSPYFSNYKVPVLLDGDSIIWDSLSILEYLSENYVQSPGWPQDPKARAMARSVSAEMHSSFHALRNELPMNCRKNVSEFALSNEAKKDINRIQEIWRMSKNVYGAKGDWLYGDYSVADAMFAPVVLRFKSYGVSLGEIANSYVQNYLDNENLKAWMAAGKSEKEIIEIAEV